METKDQLIKTIREWVKIDNEIRALQKEQNSRKKEKKDISSSLINIMKSNEIDCFELNDGQLIYNKKNVKKPITKKTLLYILSKYYQCDASKAG
jgi:seryl-tRNA synthetase